MRNKAAKLLKRIAVLHKDDPKEQRLFYKFLKKAWTKSTRHEKLIGLNVLMQPIINNQGK